jgi:hypothetical protein
MAESVQMKATVTTASPIRVRVDGAVTDSPAVALNGTAYTLGARVTVTVRNPIPPLVIGADNG